MLCGHTDLNKGKNKCDSAVLIQVGETEDPLKQSKNLYMYQYSRYFFIQISSLKNQ